MSLIRHKGSFERTEKFLKKGKYFKLSLQDILNYYGQKGVQALAAATPVDTGKTAASWSYEIRETENGIAIEFHNSNVQKGYANIAILLDVGHATRGGGYVLGRHYISPTIQPIFDEMAEVVWKKVKGLWPRR